MGFDLGALLFDALSGAGIGGAAEAVGGAALADSAATAAPVVAGDLAAGAGETALASSLAAPIGSGVEAGLVGGAAPALTAAEMATGTGAADALMAGTGADAAAGTMAATGTDLVGSGSLVPSASTISPADALGNSYITGGPESMGGAPAALDATASTSAPIDYTSSGAQTAAQDAYGTTSTAPDYTSQAAGDAAKAAYGPASDNSSITSALKQLGVTPGNALKYGVPVASLAMNGKAQHKAQSAADQLNKIAQPASSTSNNLLSKFNSGQISAADSYAINQQMQQSIAQAKQYYASAGLSNSSMEHEAIQTIQNNAENQRQQALQNMLTQGLSAAGTAQGPQIAAVNASVQSDAQLQKATSDFMAALARMNAGGTTPNQPTPTPSGS